MDDKRKGEIAYELLKWRLAKDGVKDFINLKRGLGDVAKKTGISPDELKAFMKMALDDVVEESLS